jgi:hypothetical protein
VGIARNQTGHIAPIFVGDAHHLLSKRWAKAVFLTKDIARPTHHQ